MTFNTADFDPTKKLSAENLATLRELTTDQIAELAKEYPNQPRGNAYLILYDKSLPADKQIFSLSTFQNLANLHKLGKTNYTPWAFRTGNRVVVNQVKGTAAKPKGKKTVDLSAADIASAAGLKKAGTPTTPAGMTEDQFAEKLKQGLSTAPATANGGDDAENKLMQDYLNAKAAHDEAVEKKAHNFSIRALAKKMADAATAAGL